MLNLNSIVFAVTSLQLYGCTEYLLSTFKPLGGSVAEWLVCWTQPQKGLGSNHSHDAVG